MSRATTSGPVSDSLVLIGYFDSSARISLIGRDRSILTTSSSSSSSSVSGRYCAGSVSSCSRKMPSRVILPSACRSAEQDTAMATGQEAPCRGSLITRTSWQKYLPPNCAPMPLRLVISRTACSSSMSRKPCAGRRAGGRQRVEVLGRGVLGGLQRVLRAGAADHDRQMVRRAGGRSERAELLLQEGRHPLRVQHRLGLLVQVGLVRRAAALGHEQELVLGAVGARTARSGRAGCCPCCAPPTSSAARAGSTAGSAWCTRRRRRARCAPRRGRWSAPAGRACPSRSRSRCPGTSAAPRPPRCRRS